MIFLMMISMTPKTLLSMMLSWLVLRIFYNCSWLCQSLPIPICHIILYDMHLFVTISKVVSNSMLLLVQDEYFQVDNSAIKHDGFFVNRGKLERM